MVIGYVPNIFKGVIIKLLAKVTVAEAVAWVNENYSLLDKIPEKYQREIESMNLGRLNWLTADWVINAVKIDKPQLASLFQSWPQGYDWLTRQCQALKEEFTSNNL